MARPKSEEPTPGELEILNVLWNRGPSTVREVVEVLCGDRPRAYTSIMTLLNVMTTKKQVTRKAQGRAFVYSAKRPREKTLGQLLKGLVSRAFQGSASQLVAHLCEECDPSPEELAAIRRTIADYERQADKP